jgi:hypothetical protein
MQHGRPKESKTRKYARRTANNIRPLEQKQLEKEITSLHHASSEAIKTQKQN